MAAALGPPLGGLLVELSWRWIFLVNLPIGLVTVIAGLRVLREIRDEQSRRLPDPLGPLLLAAAVAAVTLGFVQGPEWGWDGRVAAALAGGAVLTALFVLRSARHPEPLFDLDLMRERSFALAGAAALLFFAGFAAMLLGNILFLTEVWSYSVLEAGFAVAPGPAMAAVSAGMAARLSRRHGPRVLGAAGGAIFALGCLWWISRVQAEPSYAAAFLPGMVIGGAGVGLVLPSFTAAAAAALPPARLATGIGVNTMLRQIGAALGIALWIAVVGTPSPGDAISAFGEGWWLMAAASAGAAVCLAALGPVPRPAAVPVPAASLGE